MFTSQLQLDELYAVLRGVKAGEISAENAIKRLERSRHWVWTAIDPVSKLLLAIDVGKRTLAMAQRVVHQVAQVLAPDCVPLFLTDGFREYMTAVLTHFGQWMQPARRRAQGPAPQPRWMPRPHLLYAQVGALGVIAGKCTVSVSITHLRREPPYQDSCAHGAYPHVCSKFAG